MHDFAVLPDGSKAYLAALGPWLPNYEATGWLYAADLQNGAVRELPIDGGAMALTLNTGEQPSLRGRRLAGPS